MVATTEVVCCCVTVDREGCVCPSPCCCPCCGGTEPEGGTNPPPDDGGSGDEGNDGSAPPPDDGNPPPDDEGGKDPPPPSPCGGITYLTPFPSLFGSIVEPEAEEVTVFVGETVTFKANGFPDPDLDRQISRAPNPEGGCVSSVQTVNGPSLSFLWRLWRDSDGDNSPDTLVGVIGSGRAISWQAPQEGGVYWVELTVDDDSDPDYDAPAKEVKCAKCTEYSNPDDPAVKDWVKVNVIPIKVRLSIHPDEPSILSADDGNCFIVMEVLVLNPETGEWEEADDGSQVQWTLFSQPEGSGFLFNYTASTQAGFAVTQLITNRQAHTSHRIRGRVTRLVYRGISYSIPELMATTETITVVPGLAAIFSFRGWQGIEGEPQPLPANEMSFISFSLQVKDRWGNLVADGTPISFLLEGTGALHQQTPPDRENFDGDSEGVLYGGIVTKTLRAGMFAEKMIIHAVADGSVFSFFNPNNPILVTVELPYQQVTLPKAGDEPLRIPVIARVQQVVGMEENGQLILQPVLEGSEPLSALSLSQGVSVTNKVKVQGRVVPKRLFAHVLAFAKGFLTGEEESAVGLVGDIVASFLIWGDLRDFLKELGKSILPGQKADWVVFGFATLGLATTLYPLADPFVAIAKVVVKVCRRLGTVGKRLAEILVRQSISAIRKALNGDLSMMNALKEFLGKVVGKPPIQEQIERVKRLASLVKCHKSFACGDWLKIGKDITAEQLQRLQKTVWELAGEKVIGEHLAGLLVECLGKLEKEVKEELADLADEARKDLMTGVARAIKSGVDTSLMAKVLNAPLIKTYGRTTFLQKLTYYAADAENLTDVFRGILHPDHGKSFLFEFHAGTWEAEKKQAKVTHFRKKLKSRAASASAEIDAILSDGTHIQASVGSLINPQEWKEEYGKRIAVSKAELVLLREPRFREDLDISILRERSGVEWWSINLGFHEATMQLQGYEFCDRMMTLGKELFIEFDGVFGVAGHEIAVVGMPDYSELYPHYYASVEFLKLLKEGVLREIPERKHLYESPIWFYLLNKEIYEASKEYIAKLPFKRVEKLSHGGALLFVDYPYTFEFFDKPRIHYID